MKISATILGLAVLAGGASGAAEFSAETCRQLWPFSPHVEVKFTAANVTGLEKVTLTLSEGDRTLGTVPVSAYRETSGVIDANGEHVLRFDPSAVPALSLRGAVKDLRVTVASSSEAVDSATVLYRIFDLTRSAGTTGAKEFVTEEALRQGAWGAWEETVWPNVTAVKTPVWTGVTNDTKYALTHLVMRRIDAGTFTFGYSSTADVGTNAPNYAARSITLTKPYYIGVYQFTRKQIRLLTGNVSQEALNRPSVRDSFDQIRGKYTVPGGPYDWPTDRTVDPKSYIGLLRARTGAAFDLPTEAQWEKAARAGSDGVYYDGCVKTQRAERNAIAWNGYDVKTVGDLVAVHPVGLLKPNNYGLYDTLGNVWEYVLDWQAGGTYDLETVDPVGAPAATAFSSSGKPKRVVRGASAYQTWERVTLHERTQEPVNMVESDYGWRVALPAD